MSKQVIANYTFSHAAKTITLTDFTTVLLARLVLITDTTTNKILYNFADPTVSTATVATNVITLSALQGGEADTDKLRVDYDSLAADPSIPLPVALATNIAGEDLTNDRLKVSSEVALLATHTQNAVSLLTTVANTSTAISCADYRTYSMMGFAGTSTMKLLLQVSPDGTNWFWHPNGETTSNQFPPTQLGVLTYYQCRVVATNTSGGTQTLDAWLTLGR